MRHQINYALDISLRKTATKCPEFFEQIEIIFQDYQGTGVRAENM